MEVVDDQVEASLGNDAHQRLEHLQRARAVLEDHLARASNMSTVEPTANARRAPRGARSGTHRVVADELLCVGEGGGREDLELLELKHGRLPVIQAVVVACLEVDGCGAVREVLQVHTQHLLRHIVVIELVVAQSHEGVQRQVLPVFQEHALVHVNGLLVMAAHVVDGCQAQLVLHNITQQLVVLEQLALVPELSAAMSAHTSTERAHQESAAHFMHHVEQHTVGQRRCRS